MEPVGNLREVQEELEDTSNDPFPYLNEIMHTKYQQQLVKMKWKLDDVHNQWSSNHIMLLLTKQYTPQASQFYSSMKQPVSSRQK